MGRGRAKSLLKKKQDNCFVQFFPSTHNIPWWVGVLQNRKTPPNRFTLLASWTKFKGPRQSYIRIRSHKTPRSRRCDQTGMTSVYHTVLPGIQQQYSHTVNFVQFFRSTGGVKKQKKNTAKSLLKFLEVEILKMLVLL